MSVRLCRDVVAAYLAILASRAHLTVLQSTRLAALLGILDGEGCFLLREALRAGEFPSGDARGQEAFQDFRKKVNQAAAAAGVRFRVELDAHKVVPDRRYGWFTGADLIEEEGIVEFTAQAARRTGIHHPVAPRVTERLAPGTPGSPNARITEAGVTEAGVGPPLAAGDRLVEWATDPRDGAPRVCALLGDVGMGKTTTAKLFTQRLLQLRAPGAGYPLPIWFDLRDARIRDLAETMTLERILDSALDATRPLGIPRERLNAEVLRRRLAAGDAVVVFDGLDEVLVRLSPRDRHLVTRQLWRALCGESGSKMLLTCRTQYFRTIREEVGFFDEVGLFTGEDRPGVRGKDYLALLMLALRPEQVREYLAANLGRDGEWARAFLDTLAAVPDLTDLASRPVTLRMIAEQVEFIENATLAGRELRSVDLYAEVVDRWLARDTARHTLTPEHKQLLMEEIAAGLWRSGRTCWEAAEVDDWLLDLLARRPDLRRHYREHLPDLWKADLRTATFLSRRGDVFAFGHRSLAEYFLARYLARALTEPDTAREAWALPVPSPATLDFVGQHLAGCPAEHQANTLTTLTTINHPDIRIPRRTWELAQAYARHARHHGYPHQ